MFREKHLSHLGNPDLIKFNIRQFCSDVNNFFIDNYVFMHFSLFVIFFEQVKSAQYQTVNRLTGTIEKYRQFGIGISVNISVYDRYALFFCKSFQTVRYKYSVFGVLKFKTVRVAKSVRHFFVLSRRGGKPYVFVSQGNGNISLKCIGTVGVKAGKVYRINRFK